MLVFLKIFMLVIIYCLSPAFYSTPFLYSFLPYTINFTSFIGFSSFYSVDFFLIFVYFNRSILNTTGRLYNFYGSV